MSSCLEDNASGWITNLVYDMDLLTGNNIHMVCPHHVELSQGIEGVLRGNQQWTWGESLCTQSYGMRIVEHLDSNTASCRIDGFVDCGVGDSSGTSSPLQDKLPSVGGSDINVCALHGYAIAAFDKDNATAGHVIC